MITCTSFRRRPESSVIYPLTRGRHLGSGFRRSDAYTAIVLIDAFDPPSYRQVISYPWEKRLKTLPQ